MRRALAVVLFVALTACAVGLQRGWQGADVHRVDGTWIGTEVACTAADLRCSTIVALAQRELPVETQGRVVRGYLANLPTTYVTDNGETRTARLGAGILTREAVVFDMADGSRWVIGLWCHEPARGSGDTSYAEWSCEIVPLEYWLDGHAPPSYPPGTVFS